jgi:hypothetical protein
MIVYDQNGIGLFFNYPGYSMYQMAIGTNGQFYSALASGSSDETYSSLIIQASILPSL